MGANRVFLLIFIGLATFGVVFVFKKPEIFQEFWLWILGLAGFIIKVGRIGLDLLKRLLASIAGRVQAQKEEFANQR